MAFIEKLITIRDDLSNYHRDRDDLLFQHINDRLNKSLSVYYQELISTSEYLSRKDSLKMMKRINKELK